MYFIAEITYRTRKLVDEAPCLDWAEEKAITHNFKTGSPTAILDEQFRIIREFNDWRYEV